jgi:SynChlorMet cassette protein ScmD
MDPGDTPLANPVVVLREEFDDWAVLYNPDTAVAVGLSPTAVAAWKLIDGRRDIEAIVTEVTAAYSDVPETAGDEVRELLDGFLRDGFVGVPDGD